LSDLKKRAQELKREIIYGNDAETMSVEKEESIKLPF
jgi:hypothetical protein